MITTQNLKYSLKNLWARKSRSFLTILSIFVGITTIFVFISFGLGLVSYVEEISSEVGADKFLVQADGGNFNSDTTFALQERDLRVVERTRGVKDAGPFYIIPVEIEDNNEVRFVNVYGYREDKSEITFSFFSVDVEEGRRLRASDNNKVLAGSNYQEPNRIFTKPLQLGQKITIDDRRFEVVGFMEPVGNPDDDRALYMIENDIDEYYDEDFSAIVGQVTSIEEMDQVIDRVTRELRKSRGLEEGKEDFFVQSFQDLLSSFTAVLNVIVAFVIGVAFISIIVSAVNTTNTMVTSVLERIKEIGIMKSIGATNSTIFIIFLVESSVLGLVAGIGGVGLGWIIAEFARVLLTGLGWGFLSPAYASWLFFGCVGFATLVGALSGTIPAIQAAKSNPVEALRYE